jgi:hypothetical protein
VIRHFEQIKHAERVRKIESGGARSAKGIRRAKHRLAGDPNVCDRDRAAEGLGSKSSGSKPDPRTASHPRMQSICRSRPLSIQRARTPSDAARDRCCARGESTDFLRVRRSVPGCDGSMPRDSRMTARCPHLDHRRRFEKESPLPFVRMYQSIQFVSNVADETPSQCILNRGGVLARSIARASARRE